MTKQRLILVPLVLLMFIALPAKATNTTSISTTTTTGNWFPRSPVTILLGYTNFTATLEKTFTFYQDSTLVPLAYPTYTLTVTDTLGLGAGDDGLTVLHLTQTSDKVNITLTLDHSPHTAGINEVTVTDSDRKIAQEVNYTTKFYLFVHNETVSLFTDYNATGWSNQALADDNVDALLDTFTIPKGNTAAVSGTLMLKFESGESLTATMDQLMGVFVPLLITVAALSLVFGLILVFSKRMTSGK